MIFKHLFNFLFFFVLRSLNYITLHLFPSLITKDFWVVYHIDRPFYNLSFTICSQYLQLLEQLIRSALFAFQHRRQQGGRGSRLDRSVTVKHQSLCKVTVVFINYLSDKVSLLFFDVARQVGYLCDAYQIFIC